MKLCNNFSNFAISMLGWNGCMSSSSVCGSASFEGLSRRLGLEDVAELSYLVPTGKLAVNIDFEGLLFCTTNLVPCNETGKNRILWSTVNFVSFCFLDYGIIQHTMYCVFCIHSGTEVLFVGCRFESFCFWYIDVEAMHEKPSDTALQNVALIRGHPR